VSDLRFAGKNGRAPRARRRARRCISIRRWKSASLYEGEEMKDGPALGVLAEECAKKAIEFVRNPVRL
jgi:hypothetical protein